MFLGKGFHPNDTRVVVAESGLQRLPAIYGFNGNLRYRYLDHRPANEDNSLVAKGYFVNDLVLNYTKPRYEIEIAVSNLFNLKWKETQFNIVTRLKGEQATEGITFTPGTKFASVLHPSYFFK